MTRKAGLWIDHRKAVLVTQDGEVVHLETILSHAEPKLRLAGGARSKTPYGPQDIAPEGRRDRRIRQELHRFYEEVTRHLGDVDSLLVMGPGEAKQEFACEFMNRPSNRDIPVDIEPADKMKDAQILAHVTCNWHHRQYY